VAREPAWKSLSQLLSSAQKARAGNGAWLEKLKLARKPDELSYKKRCETFFF